MKHATDVAAQVTLLVTLKDIVDKNFGEIDGTHAQVATRTVQSTSESLQAMAPSAEELAASVREIANTIV